MMVSSMFTEQELAFLTENTSMYREFSAEALKIRAHGITRYSARTIGEFLRHHTAVRGGKSDYKINNNDIPMMARIFMKVWQCPGFFETRKQGGRDGSSE